MSYSIGVDYGTNSVRALVVDVANGRELGSAVVDYPSGKAGILLDARDHHLARQHPGDYLLGLEQSVRQALAQAARTPGFAAEAVVGIGVDTTGSSPLPVDENNVPLALHERWKTHLAAQCWLWKDHTSHREAAAHNPRSPLELRPQYIAKCGDVVFFGMVLVQDLAMSALCAREVFDCRLTAGSSWPTWIPVGIVPASIDPSRG